MTPTLKISSDQDGKRLDVILARHYRDHSRSFLQKWIREGKVTQGGEKLIPNYRVQAGETIEVSGFAAPSSDAAEPFFARKKVGKTYRGLGQAAPTVLFEDASLLVLNKPANLVVHPAPSHKGHTLVDWLEAYLGKKVTGLFSDASRLGVVHRLDKDTTGVLLVAKTVLAQHRLGKQFQDRVVKKTYAAFVEGIPEAKKGIITAPIGRSQNVPSRMAVSSNGRPSETSFEVAEVFPAPKLWAGAPSRSGAQEVTLMNLHPKTGRTHQIRVHCAAIGHPIVGDETYGWHRKWAKEYGIDRPLLHAEEIEFLHPVTHKRVHFEAPWPADMRKALKMFRASAKAVALAALVSGVQGARAEEGAGAAPVKHKAASAASAPARSPGTQALKKEMASLKEQFKTLIEEVSALQDRVTGIQSSLDELGASRRLKDMEKALSDLNGKAANTANISEETKSQMLDLSRKVKAQQDTLDQLRDQVDRLRQELTQAKAREESPPPAPAPKP